MIAITIKGVDLLFQTEEANFSPNAIDSGTLAMLQTVDFMPEDKVLDLGCGYGVVGILAAKIIGADRVVMCDIAEASIRASCENAKKNGVEQVSIRRSDAYEAVPENDFTMILSNPPYHTDFSVAKAFIEGGYRRLVVGGKLIMVTKRLTWYKNKLTAVFGGVRVQEINGYYVFTAEKRAGNQKKKEESKKQSMSKKLRRKYAGMQKSIRNKNNGN